MLKNILIAVAVSTLIPMTAMAKKVRINDALCTCESAVSIGYDCTVYWTNVLPGGGVDDQHVHVTASTTPDDANDFDDDDITETETVTHGATVNEALVEIEGIEYNFNALFTSLTFPMVDPDSIYGDEDVDFLDQDIVAKVAEYGNNPEGGEDEEEEEDDHGNSTEKLKANIHCSLPESD